MSESSKNILGKSWDTVWIPYHDGVNGYISISVPLKTIRSEDPVLAAKRIYWNSRRALLEQANFSKWDNDGTPTDGNQSVNKRFILNGTKEDVNIFRKKLQQK